MPPSALLKVVGLRKSFPARRSAPVAAVDDVTFDLEAGASLGIVGQSGSGKTTVGKLVSRLVNANAGRILFDGKDIGAIGPAAFARHHLRRRLQHVFQDPGQSLTPHLRADRTIADPLLRFGFDGDVAHEVQRLARTVGLTPELLERYPHQLSGGQQARVGIARALAPAPSLLVLDEPTAALDVSVQAGILKLLYELRQRTGIGFLFISHDIELVRLMCDHVLVMRNGKMIEYGTTRDVLEKPAATYTRELLAARPRLIGNGPPGPQRK